MLLLKIYKQFCLKKCLNYYLNVVNLISYSGIYCNKVTALVQEILHKTEKENSIFKWQNINNQNYNKLRIKLSVINLLTVLCSSRKYLYPPEEEFLKIRRGRSGGVFKPKFQWKELMN